jgi:hypothetical protein
MAKVESTTIVQTAICELGIRHDRCSGTIRSIAQGDSPCLCECHGPLPDPEDELELAAEAVAEAQLEAALEARMFGAVL